MGKQPPKIQTPPQTEHRPRFKNAAAIKILEEDVGCNPIIISLHPPPETQTQPWTRWEAPSLRDVIRPQNFGGGWQIELKIIIFPSSSKKSHAAPKKKIGPITQQFLLL